MARASLVNQPYFSFVWAEGKNTSGNYGQLSVAHFLNLQSANQITGLHKLRDLSHDIVTRVHKRTAREIYYGEICGDRAREESATDTSTLSLCNFAKRLKLVMHTISASVPLESRRSLARSQQLIPEIP